MIHCFFQTVVSAAFFLSLLEPRVGFYSAAADYLCLSREWVLKSGMLIAMSVYTYLRLIVDHGAPNLLPLRQKEVDFCISMLREKVIRRGRKYGVVCYVFNAFSLH